MGSALKMRVKTTRDFYKKYLYEQTVQSMTTKLIPGILILIGFVFNDLFFLQSIPAALTRLFPISLAVFLLVFHWMTKDRYLFGKTRLYNIFLFSLLVMMYTLALLLYDHGSFPGVVNGLILVIFLISLDARTGFVNTILLYFIPSLIFAVALFLKGEVRPEQLSMLTNVFPMLVLGFIINRLQNKFRYDLFKSKHLLETQKQKAEAMAMEMQETNKALNRANAELISSENRLKQLVHTRDKFFSIIAHDLRNPFNALFGFSQLLTEKDPVKEPEKVKKDAVAIRDAAEKLYMLTDNLLQWSLSQLGEISIQSGVIEVSEITDAVMEIAFMQADAKGISLESKNGHEIFVNADRETTLIVMRNIVFNAIKYSYPGGKVSIESRRDDSAKKAFISVSDQGVGIPGTRLETLFSLEDSSSKPGTNGEPGTGLGLILSNNLIRMNKGCITVKSREGKGSTFEVSLPLV